MLGVSWREVSSGESDMLKTRLCGDLAIDHPIFSAPLGGGNAGIP